MKIVSLQAENIKRLRAVEITPDGNTVIVSGRNGQGKTSVLDSIWFALGGGPATKDTARPIRDGQTEASVTLDLGELRVTRTWTEDKTSLRVENADGARYGSPQAMLDSLVGRMSFDPLAFAGQDGRKQLAILLDLIDLPFDLAELDRERLALYEERTTIGREGKALAGQLQGTPEPPPDLPGEEVSATAVLAEYRQAQVQNRAVEDHRAEAGHHERAVADLRARLTAAEQDLAREQAWLTHAAPPADLDTYEKRLAELEQTNTAVRAAAERARVTERHNTARASYDKLTAGIAALDKRKAAAIRDAVMPIDGLAFDDDGVTYRGIPFKQCSAAEQLRVSLAMAMAMNPKIRVIRITDGSLLDSENMRLIEEMATEHDYQCWIERVDETGKVGVYIEDGQVAVPEPVAVS